MFRHAYPEFHKALLEQSAYPAAPRRIKFEETRRSYLYRTGEHVYKIRKTSALYSTPAVKERYAQIALTLGRQWAGETVQAVLPIARTAQGYALGAPGEPVDYALRMAQLPDSHWLHRLLEHGKLTATHVGKLARFVAEHHAGGALDEKAAELAHPARVRELLDELVYQSRKHCGHTVSEPVLELIARPLTKYLEEVRRLMVRRLKRGRVVEGHGALLPEHLFLHGNDIFALAPLEAQPKYRRLDAANDLAGLVNALSLRGHLELADLFVTRYAAAARDRDLPRVLPVYRLLQALRGGLLRSEWAAELPPASDARREMAHEATGYYTLAVQIARGLHATA